MTFGEISELCYRMAESSGCDERDEEHAFTMGRITSYIRLLAYERHSEIYGEKTDGTLIDSDIEMTRGSLFDLLSELEAITDEDDLILALYKVLSDYERSVLLDLSRLVSLSQFSTKTPSTIESQKQIIEKEILCRLEEDAILRPVVEALMEGNDLTESIKTVLLESGQNIERARIPQETSMFVQTFRKKVERLMGNTAKA